MVCRARLGATLALEGLWLAVLPKGVRGGAPRWRWGGARLPVRTAPGGKVPGRGLKLEHWGG